MALRGSTLPSAGSHSDLDLLAESDLDLPSWLFQDGLYQQDFGKGAKDIHSISSAVAGYASPPFITSQDLPDWMEASTDINWDQPLNLEEVLNSDLKQQIQQTYPPSYQLPNEFTTDLFVDPNPPSQIFAPQHQSEYQKILVQENEAKDVVYSQDSPLSAEGFENGSSSFNSSEESFTAGEEKLFRQCASPFIISVPLTEVFAEQKPPVFKTINITGIERINVAQKPFFCSTPIQSVASSPLPPNERREPQKIVINLRRVTLPAAHSTAPKVEVLPPVEPLQQTGPTLMEVLTRGDADDLIRDMVIMPAQSLETDRQKDLVIQSSEDFEDSGFTGGFGSPSELLLFSPSSSSGIGSTCGSVHSPETYDGNNSHDGMEDDELSQNVACGRSTSPGADRGESLRYAPYKSLEKKMRKKEQNKRAALRYRQKKKEEEEAVLSTYQQEEERQKQLNEKYNAMQMEVKLMKKLMREMLVTKKSSLKK